MSTSFITIPKKNCSFWCVAPVILIVAFSWKLSGILAYEMFSVISFIYVWFSCRSFGNVFKTGFFSMRSFLYQWYSQNVFLGPKIHLACPEQCFESHHSHLIYVIHYWFRMRFQKGQWSLYVSLVVKLLWHWTHLTKTTRFITQVLIRSLV